MQTPSSSSTHPHHNHTADTPSTPKAYSLSGILRDSFLEFDARSGRKVSTFLDHRPNGARPQYITMSIMTYERMKERIENGEIDPNQPVQVLGSYFRSKATNPQGRRRPDGFHIKGMRQLAS